MGQTVALRGPSRCADYIRSCRSRPEQCRREGARHRSGRRRDSSATLFPSRTLENLSTVRWPVGFLRMPAAEASTGRILRMKRRTTIASSPNRLVHLLSCGGAARVDRSRRTASRSVFGRLAGVPIPVLRFIIETRLAIRPPSETSGSRGSKRETTPRFRLGQLCHRETCPERPRYSPNHGRRL